MSLTTIEINFQSAQEQANRIEEAANSMKQLANQQMTETFQRISACWKGEAASAYLSKAEKVKQEVTSTADALYTIAKKIREQARRIYEAEKQAIAIAQSNIQ